MSLKGQVYSVEGRVSMIEGSQRSAVGAPGSGEIRQLSGQHLWITDDEGKEHPYRFFNREIALKEGHRVRVLHSKRTDRPLRFQNLDLNRFWRLAWFTPPSSGWDSRFWGALGRILTSLFLAFWMVLPLFNLLTAFSVVRSFAKKEDFSLIARRRFPLSLLLLGAIFLAYLPLLNRIAPLPDPEITVSPLTQARLLLGVAEGYDFLRGIEALELEVEPKKAALFEKLLEMPAEEVAEKGGFRPIVLSPENLSNLALKEIPALKKLHPLFWDLLWLHLVSFLCWPLAAFRVWVKLRSEDVICRRLDALCQ